MKAEIVLQVFCGQAELNIKSVSSQSMDTQSIDDLYSKRLVCRFWEGCVDNTFELLACIYNTADSHITTQQSIGLNCRPVVVKRDYARCIRRNFGIENILDGQGYVFQNVPVFNQINLVENVNICRMDRIEVNELIQL